MANENKVTTGLLFRLIVGIFVPILVAFLFMGSILFLNIDIGNFHFPSIRGIWGNSMNELGAASLKESTAALNKLGEQIIQQKAEDVAKQLEIQFRLVNKKQPMDKLRNDPGLQEMAVQKVGLTGYTAVNDDQAITHFHSNPKLVGTDLHVLAAKLPEFWKVLEASLSGKAIGGYYNWKDPDGKIRAKYMYIVNVKGTKLNVAATTYIDEFSKPAQVITEKMNQTQQLYSSQYNKRFGLLLFILTVVLFILLGVVYLYSYSVVRPLRHLAEVADKISMGDLKATIDVQGKGEIAMLAQSIERMQTSVRAAIERLQKRSGK
jgi:HAMP domain-containing protein